MTDKEILERYKMALEAIVNLEYGHFFLNAKNIANLALEGDKGKPFIVDLNEVSPP